MANHEEELKKEVARMREQYEKAIPRLTDLAARVIDVLKNNGASAPEVAAVCLNLLLQTIDHTFGEIYAHALDEAISQVLAQFDEDTLSQELLRQTRNQARAN